MIVRLLAELPDHMNTDTFVGLLQGAGVRVRESSVCPVEGFDIERLTEAELAVLRALRNCDSNQEIAECLHIGVSTVKTHLKRIFKKLGVRTRAAAAVAAVIWGLDEPLPPA